MSRRPAVRECNLLFLDVETGGLSAADRDIVEIACVLTDPTGMTILAEYVSKVLPTNPVDAQAAAINGYDQEKWAAEAVSLNTAMVKVLELARNAVMSCHNSPFDKAFIDAALRRCSMRWTGNYHTLDTCALSRPLLLAGLVDNVKLETMTKFFGIDHEAHRALGDVHACRQVYLRLMEIYGPAIATFAAQHTANRGV
jgi:DNA polymerase III alpha subunit (gram-positive type)